MLKKIFLISLASFLVVLPAMAQTTTGNTIGETQNRIAPADLTTGLKNQLITAGFKNVEAIQATADKFLPPTYYFRVQAENINKSWGDIGNVVSIFIVDTADKTWLYNKGETEVIDFAGRMQVRTSNPGQYIVVTGPDREKMVLLSHNLKVLQ
jgi:hypothetical protein